MKTIADIARNLNDRAPTHPFGRFRELRGRPSRTRKIFTESTIFPEYDFHDGGRHEIQFNIGIEERDGRAVLRYGIAFSLATSQSHPDLSELFPKIDLYNHYLRTDPSAFPRFLMWHWDARGRSAESAPGPIESALATTGNFIFLGKWTWLETVDLDEVLDVFWQLLPLYLFVETGDYGPLTSEPEEVFRSGCAPRKTITTASRTPGVLDVALRHNELQGALHKALCRAHGEENVATEHPLDCGGRVDAVVRGSGTMAFYEIKVAPSARCALRDAVGQLLEYAHWPNAIRADQLVVVGEAMANDQTLDYLAGLRRRFGMGLTYRRLDLVTGELDPPA